MTDGCSAMGGSFFGSAKERYQVLQEQGDIQINAEQLYDAVKRVRADLPNQPNFGFMEDLWKLLTKEHTNEH